MNLHRIVSGGIAAINPFETVAISISTGYTTDADGTRLPTYTIISATAQIQALQFRDLQQLEGLNLNGTRRKIYFYGIVDATLRALEKGGDVVTRSDGSEWLVAQVLEQWPDWCSVAVTLQDKEYTP